MPAAASGQMPAALESLPKGHQFPPTSFELIPEWVREYTESVDDDTIGALGPGLVPPMAVAALSVRALLESAPLPVGAVHVAQELAFSRPVSEGQGLVVKAGVASRGERQGWVLMGVDLQVETDRHELVMTGKAMVTFPSGVGPGTRNA